MSRLRRVVLVRHGETEGNSSVRFHGAGDVALSDEGRSQMRRVVRAIRGEAFDVVVASPLRRSWQSALIVAGGAPVRLESDFREVNFGRWEGLTAEEIEALDPILYGDWMAGVEGFEYPGGERRADFRERVRRGLDRIQGSGVASGLIVVHKGVIRIIGETLLGAPIDDGAPPLGGHVSLTRRASGAWIQGRRSSHPAPR